MGFAQHEDSTGLCATGVKVIAYTSTMELVLSHHKGRCICYQYFYMIVERRTIPLRPNNNRQAELFKKKISYVNSTECIERELVAFLLEAMRQYNKDNADLSSTHHSGRSPKVVALFTATNFSSNIIELLQLHDTIEIKWNYA